MPFGSDKPLSRNLNAVVMTYSALPILENRRDEAGDGVCDALVMLAETSGYGIHWLRAQSIKIRGRNVKSSMTIFPIFLRTRDRHA